MATRDIKKLQEMEAVKKPDFDPTKNYTWDAKQVFGITGSELERLHVAFAKQTTNAPDFEKFLWLQEGMNILNSILKDAFEEGIVKQVVPKPVEGGSPVGEQKKELPPDLKVVKKKEEVKSE